MTMIKLPKLSVIVITLLAINFLAAQSPGSYLYPVENTVYPQSLTPRIYNSKIYILQATYQLDLSGANFRTYLDQYTFDGSLVKHTAIDSILPQSYQVVNTQPILWVGDRLLLAMDKTTFSTPTDGQRAIILGYDPDGTQVWNHEFISSTTSSTSGVLLPSHDGKAYHVNVRASQTSNQDDLSVSLIDKNSQIAWTKYVMLPSDQERTYIRAMGGAKTSDKILVLCDYGITGGSQVGHMFIALDTSGNLVESKDLPFTGQPLLSSQPGNDTFYITESKHINTNFYYCLHTYVVSINNLINTACSNELGPINKEFEYNMSINQKGNVYTVGSSVIAGDSLKVGHVAKWSSAGALLWKKSYRLGSYPKGESGFTGLDFTENDNLVLIGGANNNYESSYPLRFTWLLLLDENGCYTDNNCNDLIVLDTISVPTENISDQNEIVFKAYPNPTVSEINVTCSTSGRIRFMDLQGKIILEKDITPEPFSISVANYPLGMYVLQFIGSKKNTLVCQKLMIINNN